MKDAYLHGAAWDLAAFPLLDTVERLSELEGVAMASLHGDRAHVIVNSEAWTPENLIRKLTELGISVQAIEPVETTLEDVFHYLAHR